MCSFDHLKFTPTAVSLTLNPCQLADNNLKIINNHPPNGVQKEFGVCTKQLSYDNRSFTFKFVEWVHLLRILGVEKIFGYNRFVHQDTTKAIKYFEDKGWVEMYPFLEPQGTVFELTSWPTRAIERVLLNDCFYRNFNLFKYIAVIDPDEILMPLKENITNYHDMIKSFPDHKQYDFFFFSYVYFSSNENDFFVQKIPAHHHMLRNVIVKNLLF